MEPPAPPRVQRLAPELVRVIAPNPSPMTYWGTNTYLLGRRSVAIVDPGPDSPEHLDRIEDSLTAGARITHILVTHAHLDHSPGAVSLSRRSGAPVFAFGNAEAGRSAVMQRLASEGLTGGGEGVDRDFEPDVRLADGEDVHGGEWTLQALHTPGHMGNHLVFAWGDTLFCGDLVMGWASSLVSPPDGDLTDFMTSCRRLREKAWSVLHPGHGAPIGAPAARLDWLLAHRESRAAQILSRLSHGPATPAGLAHAIYTETPEKLLPAATRNVFAHLVDFHGRAQVTARPHLSIDAEFSRNWTQR